MITYIGLNTLISTTSLINHDTKLGSCKNQQYHCDWDPAPLRSKANCGVDTKENSSKMTRTIKIDVVSDIICPWCYVGQRQLNKAIQSFAGKAKFEVNWHPYYLDRSLPVEGINKFKYWYSRGSKASVDASFGPTTAAGEKVGIHFKYGGDVANTARSHQLVDFAKLKGKQDEVMQEIFADYHENEKNIGDIEVLTKAAERAGLNPQEMKEDPALIDKSMRHSKPTAGTVSPSSSSTTVTPSRELAMHPPSSTSSAIS
ncbi:hypothetical protein PROFUN_03400 [Planoprotostelium fungivorum]|uniref:DSBA-like thioredoxin domain-containing protein n=1 Tax=Planoprotostelium fungivorum TaxID=1890364 RepID=A0A2P6NWF8_9EUKA|nr:hypothetical protein PROFUN_03400 [Planoprotostelium fungivorum]